MRPIRHAMPMPLRTIDDEYYAEAIGEVERVMPLLEKVLDHTHLSTSAPRTVATQLVESRPQTMAHIPLGCGFVLLPRMTYSTGERLHSPRLVGVLAYAPMLHPNWPARFVPSPSTARCVMGHLTEHIYERANLTIKNGGAASTHEVWGLLSIRVPHERYISETERARYVKNPRVPSVTSETSSACGCITRLHDLCIELGMVPLSTFLSRGAIGGVPCASGAFRLLEP
jgi:hypothetical protein